MRKTIIASAATALIGLGVLAAPVAAHADDTPTSFDLGAGSLSITVPSSATLAAATVGASSVSGQLGAVSVTDYRGDVSDSWTAAVTSSSFTGGAEGNNLTVPDTAVSYSPGSPVTGSGTFGATATAGTAGPIGTGLTAYSMTAGQGSNGVSWNPTITISLPAGGQVADTYSGTITQSVALPDSSRPRVTTWRRGGPGLRMSRPPSAAPASAGAAARRAMMPSPGPRGHFADQVRSVAGYKI